MTGLDSQTGPEISFRARALLLSLYERRKAQAGRPISANEFYPVSLLDLIKGLDWHLVEQKFDDNVLDVKGGCDFRTQTIVISQSLPPGGERNFTLAHEIAHAVLHKTDDECPFGALRVASIRRRELHNDNPGALKRERDADLFAEILLMPEKPVREHFQALFHRSHLWTGSSAVAELFQIRGREPSVGVVARQASLYGPQVGKTALSAFFGVSAQAMAIRLTKLRLIY